MIQESNRIEPSTKHKIRIRCCEGQVSRRWENLLIRRNFCTPTQVQPVRAIGGVLLLYTALL